MQLLSKLISLGAVLGLLASFHTSAQQAPAQPQQPQAPKVSQEKLKTFVKAHKAVEVVASKKKPEEMSQPATQEKLKKTIKNEGISVQEYMAILQGIQMDPNLQQRFKKLTQ